MSVLTVSDAASKPLNVTIANGASLSNGINLGIMRACSVSIPSAWTTANLTLQASHDEGTTWENVYKSDGTEYTITVSAVSTRIILDPADFASLDWIKLRSGTSGSAVNQGGDRVLTIIARSV